MSSSCHTFALLIALNHGLFPPPERAASTMRGSVHGTHAFVPLARFIFIQIDLQGRGRRSRIPWWSCHVWIPFIIPALSLHAASRVSTSLLPTNRIFWLTYETLAPSSEVVTTPSGERCPLLSRQPTPANYSYLAAGPTNVASGAPGGLTYHDQLDCVPAPRRLGGGLRVLTDLDLCAAGALERIERVFGYTSHG
ncbi:hypothetical protein B0H15DRAFT_951717 [Mycena belliarum]|uniref:Uncharacterized protein n=1 Tax=Mycena belliarum TaxID=1033014 RepID=A0AAD6TYC8_9AGAR|nr:hypothetical protein B0H15DRAFT_951717 [Mycena belliae]